MAVPILSWKFSSSMGLGLLLVGSMGTTPTIVLANVLRFSRRDLMSAILQNWKCKHNGVKLFLKSYFNFYSLGLGDFSLYFKSLLTSNDIFLWNCRSNKIVLQLYKAFKPILVKWIKIWPSSYYRHITRTFFFSQKYFVKIGIIHRVPWLRSIKD